MSLHTWWHTSSLHIWRHSTALHTWWHTTSLWHIGVHSTSHRWLTSTHTTLTSWILGMACSPSVFHSLNSERLFELLVSNSVWSNTIKIWVINKIVFNIITYSGSLWSTFKESFNVFETEVRASLLSVILFGSPRVDESPLFVFT